MIRRSFGASLIFAASAAVALPPVVLGLAPAIGRGLALGLFGIVCAAGYLSFIAPDRRRAVLAFVGTIGAGGFLIFLLPDLHQRGLLELMAGLAVVIALVRSLVFYRAAGLRGIVVEVALTLGGAIAATVVLGPSIFSLAAAVWTYFLVQSGFGLVPAMSSRMGGDGLKDPFDRATAQLESLLDRLA
jgi:hypothetical protein